MIDADLISTASTFTSLEILAAKMWWHVEEEGNMYEKIFSKKNKVIGVLWSNKRDSGLWFGLAERKDCRLGIQLLPLCPISEVLFSNFRYVKELVEWTLLALKRDGVGDDWKGFVYALQGIYDNESALQKIRKLNGFDDGNSLTNLLWWIHSRGDGVQNEVYTI
jgi:endo-1,3(4)-beta-glucanase